MLATRARPRPTALPPEPGKVSLTRAPVRFLFYFQAFLIRYAERKCAANSDTARNVDWPETLSFATATGQCKAGFSGAPTRVCNADAWSTTVSGSCLRAWLHSPVIIANRMRFQRSPAPVLPVSRTPTGASPMPARPPLVPASLATAARRSVLVPLPVCGRLPLRFRAPVTCAAPATTRTPRGPPTRSR